jgi:hypothetical protein
LEGGNPAIASGGPQGKYIVLDLLAEDEAGRRHDIEMQVRRHRAWGARSTCWLARMPAGQSIAGDDDTEVKPAIGIRLLDFDLFEAPGQAHQALWRFEMRDGKTPTVTPGPGASAQPGGAAQGRPAAGGSNRPGRLDFALRASAGGTDPEPDARDPGSGRPGLGP